MNVSIFKWFEEVSDSVSLISSGRLFVSRWVLVAKWPRGSKAVRWLTWGQPDLRIFKGDQENL